MASNPPAEAPMPTIRKPGGVAGRSVDRGGFTRGSSTAMRFRLAPVCLAPILAGVVLLGVFRAAAIESSPWRDGDRGTGQSSPAAEGLIRCQSLSLFSISDKPDNRR